VAVLLLLSSFSHVGAPSKLCLGGNNEPYRQQQWVPRPSFARAGSQSSPPSQTAPFLISEPAVMPSGLHRIQQAKQLHFVTFSCFQRKPKLMTPQSRSVFERSLELTRLAYGFRVAGYVVMPEHVHLLLTEPDTGPLATALQALKQSVSRKLALRAPEPFWQARYYDFNVWSEEKRIEKLRYIHRNPVRRGLVEKPEDWLWSSFRHYATGVEGAVEIESEWSAQKRERSGGGLVVRIGPTIEFPP
jgi:putative transposase